MSQSDPGATSVEELASKHYNATIVRWTQVNPELAILRVKPDAGVPPFHPGQYTTLGLGAWEPRLEGCQPDPVPPEKRGKLIRRAYSISNPMLNDERSGLFDHGGLDFFEFYIVLVRENAPPQKPPQLTPRLFRLQEGSRLFCGTKVTGHYTLADLEPALDRPAAEHPTVVFAGTGTGEAPHNAMTWELLRRGYQGKIVSICCVRYQRDLGYRDVHHRLMELFPNYSYVELTTRDSWIEKKVYIQDFLEQGLLEKHLGHALDPKSMHFYFCGNPSMIGIPKVVDGERTYPEVRGCIEILEARGFRADGRKERGNLHFEEYW